MLIREIINHVESIAPVAYQESYDNSGLLIGDSSAEATGAIFTLDVTEAVVDEAIGAGYNMIISHHPLIFMPLKRLNGQSDQDRCIIKAIKNNIAIYAAHTNLDNAPEGVNAMICNKMGLKNTRILQPIGDMLRKLAVFVPHEHAEKVRLSMFDAGAGRIGRYDQCSFNLSGNGTYRASENATPYLGQKGKLHTEPETLIEVLCEAHNLSAIVKAMMQAHPYEEVAYDVYPLLNKNQYAGSGMIGELEVPIDEKSFLMMVKGIFGTGVLKHSPLTNKKIERVSVCGGSGNFLIPQAMASGADVFITGELKYHDYFLAENRILLVEAGHYETEQFTKELLYQIVKEKFTTFATRISAIQTNPVNYL